MDYELEDPTFFDIDYNTDFVTIKIGKGSSVSGVGRIELKRLYSNIPTEQFFNDNGKTMQPVEATVVLF